MNAECCAAVGPIKVSRGLRRSAQSRVFSGQKRIRGAMASAPVIRTRR